MAHKPQVRSHRMSTFDIQDTFSKISDIVAQKRSIDKKTITMDSTFQELGADSIDLLEIIIQIEEQFGIEINDDDAENMSSMNEVCSYVNERRTK